MAVKAQRATDCDPFACHVRRRGGEVKSGCGRIASARMLVGWASSRALAPPALATSCSMMVRFTPRLPTNLELTALSRALCARSIESRHPGSSAGGVHIRALAEVQAEIATQFGSTENLACVVAPLMCARHIARACLRLSARFGALCSRTRCVLHGDVRRFVRFGRGEDRDCSAGADRVSQKSA